ncbi:MAG: c-type cytochrome [Flavihumibacter sp.]
MKTNAIIAVGLGALVFAACSDVRRTPGKVYMPDMAYSRAVETYTDPRELQAEGIHYTALPVEGTVSRTDEAIYLMMKDTTGQHAASASLKNPLPPLNAVQLAEAERLYMINCGICHGAKMDGNGPLFKDGAGPYSAKPANLISDPNIMKLPVGTIFHVETYGKNMMGSYASQLSNKQRWMIAAYIKSKQAGARLQPTRPRQKNKRETEIDQR